MLTALIVVAQLHCAPNASGNVDCFDAQKGGAPVEPNHFGGLHLRQSDGNLGDGRSEIRIRVTRDQWHGEA